MHKLKYIEKDGICKTPCPFIPCVKVMSHTCQMCPHFFGVNELKGHIRCANSAPEKEPTVVKDMVVILHR